MPCGARHLIIAWSVHDPRSGGCTLVTRRSVRASGSPPVFSNPILSSLSLPRRSSSGRATNALRAAEAGINVLAWNDPRMPAQLLAISDAPPVLWYRGSLECLDQPVVAIVGSRAASVVALETARRLATDLASRGITVVSGLARGVDSAAHRGALDSGRTVAVLGSGVDRVYPPEHIELADRIARERARRQRVSARERRRWRFTSRCATG